MVGIVVVTFNSEEVIGACLDSCLRAGADVLVVDNASSDRTREIVLSRAGVRCIWNQENRGFAAAVNQGIAALGTEFVLLLNPDTVLETPPETMLAGFSDPRIAAVTGRLSGFDGEEQAAFHLRSLPTPATLAFEALGINRLWPRNPVNRRYRSPHPANVEQPAAAFLMVRRSAWRAVKGFDESFYPVWFEDVDFCKRLRDDGWRIQYLPDACARHFGGHSASKIPWGSKQLFWYGSLLRYAVKHYPAASRAWVCAAVMFACVPRALAGVVQRPGVEALSVYSRVFRIAGRCLFTGRTGEKVTPAAEGEESLVGRARTAGRAAT